MTKSDNYYAQRLYQQAVLSPDVNALDTEQVSSYVEQEARALRLDPEPIIEIVNDIQRSTEEFKSAANIHEEDYTVSIAGSGTPKLDH